MLYHVTVRNITSFFMALDFVSMRMKNSENENVYVTTNIINIFVNIYTKKNRLAFAQ